MGGRKADSKEERWKGVRQQGRKDGRRKIRRTKGKKELES